MGQPARPFVPTGIGESICTAGFDADVETTDLPRVAWGGEVPARCGEHDLIG